VWLLVFLQLLHTSLSEDIEDLVSVKILLSDDVAGGAVVSAVSTSDK